MPTMGVGLRKLTHKRHDTLTINERNSATLIIAYNEACKGLDKHPNQTKSVSTKTPINHLSLLACRRVKFDGRLLTLSFYFYLIKPL